MSSEHGVLTGGTRTLCRHSAEYHMRPECAGQCTDTVQSPSAEPGDGSHILQTSEKVEKV